MKAEKESGKILTIGFQPRMSENMQMIKKIVQGKVPSMLKDKIIREKNSVLFC